MAIDIYEPGNPIGVPGGPTTKDVEEAVRKYKELEAYKRNGLASLFGPPVPVVYGTDRVKGTAICLGSTATASVTVPPDWVLKNDVPVRAAVIGLCEAPAVSIGNVWRDRDKLSNKDWIAASDSVPTYYLGETAAALTNSPAVWSASAVGTSWSGTVQLRTAKLGTSEGAIPDLQFEVRGFCSNAPNNLDAHPADVLIHLLTDSRHGIGMTTGQVEVDHGPDGATASSYRTYCTAMGWYVSRAITAQQEVASLIEELLQATNSTAIWSEGRLKVIPLADTGYGAYTPPATAAVLDADEILFEHGRDPVTVSRVPDESVFNCFPISIQSRLSDYESVTYEHVDAAHAATRRIRRAPMTTNAWIKDPSHALRISALMAQRSIYLRNTYRLRVGPRWALLEPMDLVAISDPALGLVDVICRITSIDEAEDGSLTIEAVEWPIGIATPVDLTPQPHDGFGSATGSNPPEIGVIDVQHQVDDIVTNGVPDLTARQDATDALTLAGSKTAVFYQTSAPTNPQSGYTLRTGDLWFSTDTTTNCPDSNCKGHTVDTAGAPFTGTYPHRGLYWAHRWNGTAWVTAESQALVVASEIAAGAIVADKIAANAITADKLSVGSSKNLLKNADFEATFLWTQGPPKRYVPSVWSWYTGGGAGLVVDLNVANYTLGGNTDRTTGKSTNTPYLYQAGRVGSSAGDSWLAHPGVPVTAGAQYTFSIYAAAARATGTAKVDWYDAAFALLSTSTGSSVLASESGTYPGGALLTGYKRLTVTATAPVGAVYAAPYILKADTNSGQTDSYLWFCRAQFEQGSTATGWQKSDAVVIGDGMVSADILKTSNYAEDGSGNPTAGAKLDHIGTALKVAPGNFQIGKKLLANFGLCQMYGRIYRSSWSSYNDWEVECATGQTWTLTNIGNILRLSWNGFAITDPMAITQAVHPLVARPYATTSGAVSYTDFVLTNSAGTVLDPTLAGQAGWEVYIYVFGYVA